LNLGEVTRYFKDTQSNENTENVGKLDDRLQPIPTEIHGAVVRTETQRLKQYESEGVFSFHYPDKIQKISGLVK